MVVATSCYYEKVRRTMCTEIVSYLVNLFIAKARMNYEVFLSDRFMKYLFHVNFIV